MASSSSITAEYDVFLSFRGSDTRNGFTSYLYEALRLSEITTFIDNKLERGEEISPALVQQIQTSTISVIVFSRNYAFSPYCLDELVRIIECRDSTGQHVIPVFYNVDPADIEQLRGSYGEAFAQHEAEFGGQKDKLGKWKSSLRKAIDISGWHITNDKDAPKCIRRIVLSISKKLNEEKNRILERKLQQLQGIEAEINSRLRNGESILSHKQKNEAQYWLTNVGRIKEEAKAMYKQLESSKWTMQFGVCLQRMIEEVRKLIDQNGLLASDLVTDAPQTDCEAFLTERLVGREFRSNVDSILRSLSMDEVSRIGICGMGGVGKTTLVTHVHNKLLENPTKFPNVFWVTMSQDFSIHKLQSVIAKTIKFDFGTEEDARKRAARLSKELKKRHRFVLVIDDLWNPINVIEVGIPVGSGCELIITTRSIEVCRQTNCEIIRKVEPLNEEETWDLFIESLACRLPSNVETIARSVAKQCAGLPLAIVTIARSLTGVDDLHVWKNALMELQSGIIRKEDMEEKVFRILKYSYNSLNDPTLQQCFLYCALFPEDKNIDKDDLITYLIIEGIIDPEIDLMQAKFDKGHTMLNKLTNVSLLESCSDGDSVKMHDLMRDMAIQIIKQCQPSIIESAKGLAYVPDEKYWRKDLIRVSLGWNHISEIPTDFSPSCPHLSTLLLHENEKLLSIPYSFFEHLQGLKVLNLSYTAIKELPESIAGLKDLTALLLGYSNISHIPTLSKLKSLQWLDLSGCYSIKKVPDGLECLSNLRLLNLAYTGVTEFPAGILPNLFRLQSLEYDYPSKNAEELVGLRRLEYLKWCFPGVEDLLTFDNMISKMPTKQMKLFLSVGMYNPHVFGEEDVDRTVTLTRCKMFGELRKLHLQIDCLVLNQLTLQNGRGLCSHIPAGLKWLCIDDCSGITYLFSLATLHSRLRSLENLRVTNMKGQIVLFLDSENMVPRSPDPALCISLKVLQIRYCSMQKLLPHCLLSYLQNLEIIEVHSAKGLEEIISVEDNSNTRPLSLPNLRKLHLSDLLMLKRICSEQIKCEWLQSVSIIDCKRLQNISISLPLPRLQSVRVQPRNWWQSVKWGQPDQKDALPCFVYEDYSDFVEAHDFQASEFPEFQNAFLEDAWKLTD